VIARVAPPARQFRAERDLAPIESLIPQPLAADFTRQVFKVTTGKGCLRRAGLRAAGEVGDGALVSVEVGAPTNGDRFECDRGDLGGWSAPPPAADTLAVHTWLARCEW